MIWLLLHWYYDIPMDNDYLDILGGMVDFFVCMLIYQGILYILS